MEFAQAVEVLEVVMKLFAAAAVALLTFVTPKIKAWITQKVDAQHAAELENLVNTFVLAAEQLLKADDKTGEKRKAYVQEQLKELGIITSGYVNALIEKAVYDLNLFERT